MPRITMTPKLLKPTLLRFSLLTIGVLAVLVCSLSTHAVGKDKIVVIGGGYSPSGNQVSLEKNVQFFQRLLEAQSPGTKSDIFFADGFSEGRDLQVNDISSVPLANRLMAEFFASTRDLGMYYRSHQVADIRGATTSDNLAKWFREEGSKMQTDDRLILYVTAHGGGSSDKSNPYDTTIYLWNNQKIPVSQLVKLLDGLPDGVSVMTVMVQCHSGGFARYIFDGGNASKGLSGQNRCGFFATVHSRPAAGCTSDIDEANYQEYSSFFWAAIGGQNRLGESIDRPDYDQDGAVSFEEAHAYTVLTSNTIDFPIKTSGEFLRIHSKFGKTKEDGLMSKDLTYSELLERANPSQRAILDGLSEQLELAGENRFATARSRSRQSTGRGGRPNPGRSGRPSTGRGRRPQSPTGQLKMRIAADTKRKWPELANVLSPVAIELVTKRSDEFVAAIEKHPKYKEYRRLQQQAISKGSTTLSPDRQKVKYERWVRIAENIILAENLSRTANSDLQERFRQLVAAERSTLFPLPAEETIKDKLNDIGDKKEIEGGM
jgi:hypothetical protein